MNIPDEKIADTLMSEEREARINAIRVDAQAHNPATGEIRALYGLLLIANPWAATVIIDALESAGRLDELEAKREMFKSLGVSLRATVETLSVAPRQLPDHLH